MVGAVAPASRRTPHAADPPLSFLSEPATASVWGDSSMTEKVCVIAGCNERASARGLCSMHYQRQRKYGSPHSHAVVTACLVVSDLSIQVHTTEEPITKKCPRCRGFRIDPVPRDAEYPCFKCRVSGVVPVGVGDTIELREPDDTRMLEVTYGDTASTHDYWRVPGLSRRVSVEWVGPPADTKRCFWYCDGPHVHGGRLFLPPDLYDALGIGSDPDQWVYLVEAT